MKRLICFLVLAVLGVFFLAGCSSSLYVSEDEAKEAVLKKAQGGLVETMEMKSIEGFKVYAGTATVGAQSFDFQVDAETGLVVSWLEAGANEVAEVAAVESKAVSSVTPSEGIALSEEQYIDSSAAQAIVSQQYPSAFIESVDIVEAGDGFVYDIGITYEGDSFTVTVDALTGEII